MTARVVPVRLQHNKKYVLRNGLVATCVDNPHHWNAAREPYVLSGGEGLPEWMAYCTADGICASPEYSVARPVYAEGERYVTRDGTVVTIDDDDNDHYYPLNAEGVACWTRDGKEWQNNDSHMDLMDYLHAIPVAVEAPQPEPKVEPRKKHEFLKAMANVPFEQIKPFDALPPWQRGMVKALGNKADVVIVDDVEKVTLPECVPVGADTANIGRRVNVVLLDSVHYGVIRAVKDTIYYAIEFDKPVSGRGFMWDCAGLVPSGRGWFVRYDTDDWRFADILEQPQMKEHCAIPECVTGFSEVDRAEVWSTFQAILETPISVNIPELMNDLIAARKKLNTA